MALENLLRKPLRKAALFGALALAACGGGGTGNSKDTTPPVITLSPASGTYTADRPYSCASNDPESGVKSSTFTINGSNAPANGTLSTNGTYQLHCAATNGEGMTSQKDATVTINKTTPVGPSIQSFTTPDASPLAGESGVATLVSQNATGASIDDPRTVQNPDVSGSGTIQYTYVTQSAPFTLNGRATKAGFSDATALLSITPTQLSAPFMLSQNAIDLGQSVDIQIQGQNSRDSVVAYADGNRIGALAGDLAGSVPYTPATTGTKNIAVTSYNGLESKQEAAQQLTVNQPPVPVHLHLLVQEVAGVNPGRIAVDINNTQFTIPADTTIDVPQGNLDVKLVQGQSNVHDVIDYQFTSLPNFPLKNIPLHQNQLVYSVDIGTQDQDVTLKVVSKTHPELQGASYQSFRRIWSDIVPPLDDQQTINVWTASGSGGGLYGCDQFDLDPQQLASVRVAKDSLLKYITPVWGANNITYQESTQPAPLVNGAIADGWQNYCPGFVSPGLAFRGFDMLRASAARSRDNIPEGPIAFQELKDYWWGNRGREDDTNAGFSMSDRAPAYPFPHALDIFVMKNLIPIARDAEHLRYQTNGLTGHLSL